MSGHRCSCDGLNDSDASALLLHSSFVESGTTRISQLVISQFPVEISRSEGEKFTMTLYERRPEVY